MTAEPTGDDVLATVVVLTYNGERYLEELLTAVAAPATRRPTWPAAATSPT